MPDLEFPAGHVFFRPGDAADRAYLLHAGRVEVVAGDGGRVGAFGPGDVFGEMALIEERPRALTARAVEAGRATPVTRDEFEHLLTHDPARARHYLRSLFERLRALAARRDGGPGEASKTAGGAARPAPVAPVSAAALTGLTLPAVSVPAPFMPADPVAAPATPAAPVGPVELPHAGGREAGWVVVVHPLSRKAAETLPDEGLLVTRFPLRVGRAAGAGEREALDLNDVWLLDDKPFQVSRNHCEIDVGRDGPVVRDRGSHLGCVVNDERIGGPAPTDYAPLLPGENVVVVGGRVSPYQFRVTVTRA